MKLATALLIVTALLYRIETVTHAWKIHQATGTSYLQIVSRSPIALLDIRFDSGADEDESEQG